MSFSILVPPPDVIEGIVSVHRHVGSLAHFFSVAVAGSALFVLLWQKNFPSRSTGWRIALLLGAWLASAGLSAYPRAAGVALAGFVMRGLIPAWAACALARDERFRARLLQALLFIVGICAFLGLYEWFRGRGPLFSPVTTPEFRIFSTVGHPLPLSCLLLMVIPLSLSIRSTGVRVFCFVLMIACLVGTVSRSAIGIAFLSLLAIAAALPKERVLLLKLAAGTVAALLVSIFAWTIHSPAQAAQWKTLTLQRFSVATVRAELTQSHRSSSYHTVWAMLAERPLWGGGLATYPDRYLRFMNQYTSVSVPSPDNLYLRLAADTGLLGVMAFLLLLFHALSQAVRQWRASIADRRERFLIGVGLASGLLSSFFFDSLFWPSVLVPFCVLLGVSQVPWDTSHRQIDLDILPTS